MERLLADGSTVLGVSRRPVGLNHDRLTECSLDLSSDGSGQALFERTQAWLELVGGPLAGLVHAAGASLEMADAEGPTGGWDRSMQLHAGVIAHWSELAWPTLVAGGTEVSLVLVGSPVALVGAPKAAYAASKAAQLGLSASLASRGAGLGIRSNVILPGPTLTAMTEDWSTERRNEVGLTTALHRMLEPADIAGVVAFLLGPDARCITGSVINATAGAYRGIGG